ncbi:helix-turn-helix transcriptional regulator [Variovorax paradoxus]|uniref:Helix-turn-helix transcriptional regulator n=1 Tax=Variovorax paradoxus TaxID=34073 RepID=A0A5Q0M3H7_VARPD|nr:LuxR C-terminal-related transcriptional regulator [Variovorax paradoxus]QFZ84016.1 helix-turn-helix transcriptional regulator [Variovorax paradoxus]
MQPPLPSSPSHAAQGVAPDTHTIAGDSHLAPRGATRVVARERLLARLTEARHRRCVVLQGPAGCGKSATLVAWRQALLLLGFDVAWLSLGADDDELTRWLDSLVASLKQVDPAIAREAAMLGGRGTDTEAVERTIICLLHGIAAHPRELTLVVDDLHHIGCERIHEALQCLLDYAPPNLHLVLLSRTAVPLSLARLRDQELVLELHQGDLRFTLAESGQFLKAQLGEIAARDARHLHELTDGWVAGLLLFSNLRKRKKQQARGDPPAEAPVREHVHNAGAFAQYFEREVLSHLSAAEIELLVRAAVCSRFCAPLCTVLTEPPLQQTDVVTLLARLESDNLFIVPLEGAEREPWYRLHPLLRETLLERFRALSEMQRHRVHTAAWQWFHAHGHIEDAVRHAVAAGEPAAAADMVQQSAKLLFSQGDLRQVVRLVRLLPAEQVQARPALRIWTLRMQLYAREFEAAAAGIERLQADIAPDDIVSRNALFLLRGVLALQSDDTDAAMAILPQLLQPPAEADGMALGAHRMLLSWLYMHRGEYERARSVQLDATPLLFEGSPLTGTTIGSLGGRCMVGFSYALEGQMIQVERICRDVLHKAEQRDDAHTDPACFATALLGDVLYEHNDAEGAIKLLEDRLDILERVSIPDSVLKVLTVLSAAHWVAGHPLDTFACLDRLEEYAVQLGLDRLLAHALAERVHRHLQCGELDAADACLARLDTVDARHRPAGPSARDEIHAVTAHAHVRWCIANEDLHGAAARLEPLIALCDARGWQRRVALLRLQNAFVDFRRQRVDAARRHMTVALRQGHRLGLVRSLLDTDPDALQLIGEIEQGEPLDPVLSFYVARLAAAQRTPARDASTPPAGTQRAPQTAPGLQGLDLSEREAEVLRLLAQALPNKKIARMLGLSPETVKWHLRKIYGKLGVASRDEAAARLRDLEWGGPDQA